MDAPSMKNMAALVAKYLDKESELKILDVGSYDVNGAYTPIFNNPKWTYVGLDIEPGPNVDLVVKNPYNWEEVGHNTFDVVISGQCLEHVEYPWMTMECIEEVMKPGGLHFNIVPSAGPYHAFPLDCYRFFPEGMAALAKWAGLEVIETQSKTDSIWQSTILVARKPV